LPGSRWLPIGGVWFDVLLNTGNIRRYDATDFWYLPGPSLRGQQGIGLLQVARQSLGTSIAGDRAAARTFGNGALISGLATPDSDDEDITSDIPQLRRDLDRATSGYENAGAIAVVNRRLKFTPWTMTAQQAQFLESRQFQIEEVSRWTGVPPHLLMQTEKQTSWGTGVEMQDRALARSVLGTWSKRFEERASRLLANPRTVEFDFAALERPSPDREIELDLQQVKAGVMTVDEYRDKRGWDPIPEPDVSRETSPPPAPDDDKDGADDVPAE
jgi:HK97 family phage portal protein